MRPSPVVRAILLVGFLGALFGLAVLYGTLAPNPAVGAYPGTDELGTAYSQYEGERAVVGGEVVRTDPVVIAAEYGLDEEVRLRLVGLDDSVRVSEGARLNVYGVVEADRTVRVLNAVRIPAWGTGYTYAISFLAGLWVLGRILRGWRIDRELWSLRRRARPLEILAGLRARVAGVNEDA